MVPNSSFLFSPMIVPSHPRSNSSRRNRDCQIGWWPQRRGQHSVVRLPPAPPSPCSPRLYCPRRGRLPHRLETEAAEITAEHPFKTSTSGCGFLTTSNFATVNSINVSPSRCHYTRWYRQRGSFSRLCQSLDQNFSSKKALLEVNNNNRPKDYLFIYCE